MTQNLNISRYFHILQSSSIDFTSCEKELSVFQKTYSHQSFGSDTCKLNVCIRNLALFSQIRLNLL